MAGGTRLNPPRRLTNDDASDRFTAWMPNSNAVLFDSDRSGTMGIFKQRISENAAELVTTGGKEAWFPRVSADGAWILYVVLPVSEPVRLMRVPISGGVPQLVLQMPQGRNHDCARAPASLCVVLEESQDDKQVMVSAFDPVKGRGKTLRRMGKDTSAHSFGSALSPDGSTFAIARSFDAEIRIRLLSLSGGPDREITVKGSPSITGLNWSADGKGLYCGTISAQGNALQYVDFSGNARVLYNGSNTFWGIPSPDGRFLAIYVGVDNSNVWMLEGF